MSTESRKTIVRKKPRLKHAVCKPCWELKYCPYGPLVEFFPMPDDDLPLSDVRSTYRSWIAAIRSGSLKTFGEINRAIEAILSLEPKRWKWINQYQTEELCCSVFGHICPDFFSAEPFTETKQDRRIKRGIPRDIIRWKGGRS